MKKWLGIVAVVLNMARFGAAAESSADHLLGISFKLSTLGVGADIALDLGKHFNLRGGVNYGSYDLNVAMGKADVEGNLLWLTAPILLDWHPAAGGFRVSAGGIVNKNKISLTADPLEPIELDGVEYDIERLSGDISFREFCPYVGIGVGNAVGGDGRAHFACDFGIMFHGAPKVSSRAVAASSAAQDVLDQALQNEVDNLEDDLSGFLYYPVVSVGFSIAF
ncbi:MAG: hypothetical protein QME60_02270 [Verrucomicrobiota bacterium]|nr:hypothetical protein [Verrucomicrobiota bacterium]